MPKAKKVHVKVTAPAKRKRRKVRRPNPPHTTTGKFTAPKFGSAGSGGLEIEPGPELD
ncbi:MAG: hypothetical protein KGL93_06020 [Gemmatimonadota bacterium]|nr:hypothetical protein [Gemmatimonadota bacterium]